MEQTQVKLTANQKINSLGAHTTKISVTNDEFLGTVKVTGENSQVSADKMSSLLRQLGVTGTLIVNVKGSDPLEITI